MTNTLSVTAISSGTVIDHIPHRKALLIANHLKEISKNAIIGIGLPSELLGIKDLIKLENHFLLPKELEIIALYSPNATLNIIRDFSVVEKKKPTLPETIAQHLSCPNPKCITAIEPIESRFQVEQRREGFSFRCFFCEKLFSQNEIPELHS